MSPVTWLAGRWLPGLPASSLACLLSLRHACAAQTGPRKARILCAYCAHTPGAGFSLFSASWSADTLPHSPHSAHTLLDPPPAQKTLDTSTRTPLQTLRPRKNPGHCLYACHCFSSLFLAVCRFSLLLLAVPFVSLPFVAVRCFSLLLLAFACLPLLILIFLCFSLLFLAFPCFPLLFLTFLCCSLFFLQVPCITSILMIPSSRQYSVL